MDDWANLPSDLLNKIAEGLHSYADYVRTCAVCLSWRRSLPGRRFGVPWLLLPYEGKDDDETVRGFYNLLEQKVYRLNLPEACGKLIRGSSHGWLLITDEGPELCLLNPFTRAQLHLPPKTTFPSVKEYYPDRTGDEYGFLSSDGSIDYCDKSAVLNFLVVKVILSSTPASYGYTVVAIYGPSPQLAYCRHGDEQWKKVLSEDRLVCIWDAIFHAGKLYAIDQLGQIGTCDLNVPSPKLVQLQTNLPRFLSNYSPYLVECGDGFMIVDKVIEGDEKDECGYKTDMFQIFKLNLEERLLVKVKSISNFALLLGVNYSLSIPSCALPKGGENCIYFTDDQSVYHRAWEYGGHEMGVFSLEDGSFRGFNGCETDGELVWPPPVWIMPDHSVASILQPQEIVSCD